MCPCGSSFLACDSAPPTIVPITASHLLAPQPTDGFLPLTTALYPFGDEPPLLAMSAQDAASGHGLTETLE